MEAGVDAGGEIEELANGDAVAVGSAAPFLDGVGDGLIEV